MTETQLTFKTENLETEDRQVSGVVAEPPAVTWITRDGWL